MFKHQGIWLPDGERHFPEWMTRNGELVDGKGTYQIKKFREAMKWVRAWRRAIDVGAHVGLWSMQLSKMFGVLEAFEPVGAFRECWEHNMAAQVKENDANEHLCRLVLHHSALGAKQTQVRMSINPADTGGTHVASEVESGGVQMLPLDTLSLQDVDFIKIDCEGFELQVLQGAAQTIAAFRPAIIVEQKPHKLSANYGIKGAPAVEFLQEMGYHVVREMGGDYIMVHQ